MLVYRVRVFLGVLETLLVLFLYSSYGLISKSLLFYFIIVLKIETSEQLYKIRKSQIEVFLQK